MRSFSRSSLELVWCTGAALTCRSRVVRRRALQQRSKLAIRRKFSVILDHFFLLIGCSKLQFAQLWCAHVTRVSMKHRVALSALSQRTCGTNQRFARYQSSMNAMRARTRIQTRQDHPTPSRKRRCHASRIGSAGMSTNYCEYACGSPRVAMASTRFQTTSVCASSCQPPRCFSSDTPSCSAAGQPSTSTK